MTISAEQRTARRQWLGSSDMAAVMGYDPYRNAYDVWLDKTGQLEDWDGNEATEAGDICEPGLLRYAARILGPIDDNVHAALPEAHLGANVDGIVRATGECVEAKSSMLFSSGFGHEKNDWGEFGTGDVPARVIIQCHVHVACSGAPVCHVPAIIGHRGVGMYHVPREEALCDLVCDRAKVFWENHVLLGVPPEDMRPSMDSLKRVIRRPMPHTVMIPPELVLQYRKCNRARLDAEKAEEGVKHSVIIALGDAEIGESSEGNVTYKEQVGAWKYDGESMRADGVFDKYASRKPFRVLRVTKGE